MWKWDLFCNFPAPVSEWPEEDLKDSSPFDLEGILCLHGHLWTTESGLNERTNSLQEKKHSLLSIGAFLLWNSVCFFFSKLYFPNVIYSDLSAITSFLVKVNLHQRLEKVRTACSQEFLEIDVPLHSVWDPESAQVKHCKRLVSRDRLMSLSSGSPSS